MKYCRGQLYFRSIDFDCSSPLLPTSTESKSEKKLKKILGCICLAILIVFVGFAVRDGIVIGKESTCTEDEYPEYRDLNGTLFYMGCLYILSGPATVAFLFY